MAKDSTDAEKRYEQLRQNVNRKEDEMKAQESSKIAEISKLKAKLKEAESLSKIKSLEIKGLIDQNKKTNDEVNKANADIAKVGNQLALAVKENEAKLFYIKVIAGVVFLGLYAIFLMFPKP